VKLAVCENRYTVDSGLYARQAIMVGMLGMTIMRSAPHARASGGDNAEMAAPPRTDITPTARLRGQLGLRTRPASPHTLVPRGVCLLMLLFLATGCSQLGERRQFGAEWRASSLNAVEVQSALMSLSDKVIFSVADACDRIRASSTRTDTRLSCASIRLGTGLGVLAAATSPNPFIGFVDLVTLVTLNRMWLEEPWASEMFEEADRLKLRNTFAAAETDLWSRTEGVLTVVQQQELRALILEWRAANPDQQDLSWVRLQEFASSRQAGASGRGSAPSSILGLLWLDPAANLTPATRELQESRLLAERLAFYGKRTPVILGWQVELTMARMGDSREMQRLIENSSQMTGSVGEFSAAAERLAASYERTLDELPKERAAAIEQLDQSVDRRLNAFVEQTFTALNTEREATVKQLGDEFSGGLQAAAGRLAADFDAQTTRTFDRMAEIFDRQQDQMSASLAAHLAEADAASQRLIDQIAMRLILVIAVGALIVACIAFAYRSLSARFGTARSPRAG